MVELLSVSVAARYREYMGVGSRKAHALEPNRKLSSLKALDNAPRAQSDMVAYSWKLRSFGRSFFAGQARPLIDKVDKVENHKTIDRTLNVYCILCESCLYYPDAHYCIFYDVQELRHISGSLI